MVSDLEFVEYVCGQLSGAKHITFRKMFGEYTIYREKKVVALVCDNQLFIKPTVGGRACFENVVEAFPYPGAKPWFLIEERLDDQEWLANLIGITAAELPVPKAKKPKPRKTRT